MPSVQTQHLLGNWITVGCLVILLGCVLALCIYFSYLLNDRVVSLQVGKEERKYLVHTPKKDNSQPLLIALHGYTDHPRIMEFYTGFSRSADKEGFIVVYPYGTDGGNWRKLSWNAGSCCNPALKQNTDDVAFIEKVIQDVSSRYKVDPQRIYITGFSNGAMMAHRMLAEKSDLFAAGAMVSGSVGGSVYDNPTFTNTKPTRHIPVLLIHGEEDTTVPLKGGKNEAGDGNFFSFEDSVSFWTQNNECTEEPITTDTSRGITRTFNNCKVTAQILKKTGHTWPGNPLHWLLLPKVKAFQTSQSIWEFLSAQSKK